jgi:hypothetical protein
MVSSSSRERILAAIDGRAGAVVPCCFMIFRALRARCRDEFEFALRQQQMGLDARVQLEDIAIRFSSQVSVREWVEPGPGGTPLLHRAYATPAGSITAAAKQTPDWPYGDRLPIFDDYFTPRAVTYPISGPPHLDAFRCLLADPTPEDLAAFRAQAAARKRFADEHGMLLAGGWKSQRFIDGEDKGLVGENGGTGTVIDTLMWLCGGTEPLLWAYDHPDFLGALIGIIEDWNRRRVEVHLEAGVDLIMRRAWYEGTDFWSPPLFRRFILPGLKREVELVHQAGARYGYIITSGMLPIADALLESGIDVIVGIDPGEGKGTTLGEVAKCLGGRAGLWGGVSGPLTVEEGSEAEVRRAVEEAVAVLGGTGRFILSPVDNIREDSGRARHNVEVFIATWKALAPGG